MSLSVSTTANQDCPIGWTQVTLFYPKGYKGKVNLLYDPDTKLGTQQAKAVLYILIFVFVWLGG